MKFTKDKMYILEYFLTEPLDLFEEVVSWTITPREDIERNLINDEDVKEGFVIIKEVSNK